MVYKTVGLAVLFLGGLVPIVTSLATAPLETSEDLATAAVAYYDPKTNGGSALTLQNEPMNIIISALSTPEVLSDAGILNFANALGFATECLGFHLGGYQAANLGDGHGFVNQTMILREDYGIPIGTCLESLIGGNHFRVFRQNGTLANSGALFLAASREDPATQNHDIIPNGYDIGRDDIIATATNGTISFDAVDYTSTVQYISGLLPVGANGINHDIAIDGRVALLTVNAKVQSSGFDCKGSSLCPVLSASTCDSAMSKVVNTTIYRTDSTSAATGVCSGHCGVFVQGVDCQYSGASLIEAYSQLRGQGCKICGSKRFADGCEITINYVSEC